MLLQRLCLALKTALSVAVRKVAGFEATGQIDGGGYFTSRVTFSAHHAEQWPVVMRNAIDACKRPSAEDGLHKAPPYPLFRSSSVPSPVRNTSVPGSAELRVARHPAA